MRTHLGGSASDPGCLPFGFCTCSLGQAEIMAGVVIRLSGRDASLGNFAWR